MDSIDRIKEYIEKNLSETRKNHTYGVREEALKLAEKYGCDGYKAETAALTHDIYRGKPVSALNDLVTRLGLDKKYLDDPNLSHSKIAAEMIRELFGIDDEDIINAVSFHTTGRPGMSTLEKVIYIADATESGRTYPGVEELRKAAEEDIDKACLLSLKKTIERVRAEGKYLDEDTVKAKKYFEDKVKNKGEKV